MVEMLTVVHLRGRCLANSVFFFVCRILDLLKEQKSRISQLVCGNREGRRVGNFSLIC